jgi:hypothetical protein
VRHYDRDCGVARKEFYAGRLEGKTLKEKFNPMVLAAAEGRTVAPVYLGKGRQNVFLRWRGVTK